MMEGVMTMDLTTTYSAQLSVPRQHRRRHLPGGRGGDAFGTWSESFARYMGTSKFIMQMSVFIAAWFAWNELAPVGARFDPYPFQFLTLILSLQASYAAPLILLAQNRQDDRDRSEAKIDRRRAAMDTEVNSHLARELSDVRHRLNDISLEISHQREQRPRRGLPKDLGKRLDRIEAGLEALLARA